MPRVRPTLEFRRGDELVTCVLAEPDASWFAGHFPALPILPGVSMLAWVEESIERYWGRPGEEVTITGFSRVRFRQRVQPGATLRARVRQGTPGCLRFSVDANGALACTGECGITLGTRGSVAPGSAAAAPAGSTTLSSTAAAMAQATGGGRTSAAFTSDGISSAALTARAEQWAALARDGERACLCVAVADRAEVAAALLAALAGRVQVVFPSALTPEAVGETFVARRFSHWLGSPAWLAALGGLDARPIDQPWPQAHGDEHEIERELAVAEGDCVFLPTGGTTGRPRLWAKTAGNLLDEAAEHAYALQVDESDHIVSTAVPYHAYGLMFSVLLPLFAHATVERSSPFFPGDIAHQIETSRATILVSTPTHLRALAASLTARHHLRLVISSSAPLSPVDAATFHARTGIWPLEIYGSTETGGVAVRRQDVAGAPWSPLPKVEVGQEGELLTVRSPSVSASDSGSDHFITADRTELLADGRFHLLGRADSMVKVGGKRVDLAEVETALAGLTGVRDAVALAVPCELGRGHDIVALAASERLASDLLRELREKLPTPAWPRRLRCVAAIPLTAVGKRDRAAILQYLAAQPAHEP